MTNVHVKEELFLHKTKVIQAEVVPQKFLLVFWYKIFLLLKSNNSYSVELYKNEKSRNIVTTSVFIKLVKLGLGKSKTIIWVKICERFIYNIHEINI